MRGEKIGAVITRCAHAEHQIAANIIAQQRLEREIVRDALFKLAHVHGAQVLVQLRLSKEDDVQQLVPVGFEVGEGGVEVMLVAAVLGVVA